MTRSHLSPQGGAALIVALVFLLILTILGVTAMSGANLQEKMAGNLQDQNLAFQSAETALIAAEDWINNQVSKPIFPNESIGLYVPSTGAKAVWESVDWTGSNVVIYPNQPGRAVTGDSLRVAQQPRYLIEDLGEVAEQNGSLTVAANYKGKGNTVLRVTTHATGRSPETVSELQTTYARKY